MRPVRCRGMQPVTLTCAGGLRLIDQQRGLTGGARHTHRQLDGHARLSLSRHGTGDAQDAGPRETLREQQACLERVDGFQVDARSP